MYRELVQQGFTANYSVALESYAQSQIENQIA